ncbi:MAG: CoB--CoM heterodisulfide reductase iron-sulfur subunit A family protein [Deltaproteobacteria bacterium]|nr:CoB--CoM heterodisulfide reductase iron-sulfur subunit A family protein [Deltaproteobacteria bacterium]
MTQAKEKEKQHATKVGVYICHCGGNISDHVDVEAVRRRLEKVPGVAVARTNMFMCSDPGQELIAEDLKNGVVDRVVVASCAPSLHETTFRNAIRRAGANPYIYEHANIREQVSWVHHGAAATEKAATLVEAAAAKAGLLRPLTPIRVTAARHATVIGGGVAGLSAARDLADRGIPVTLVEKSPCLGGQLARLDRIAPTGERAPELVRALADAVLNHPHITVFTDAQVIATDGYIGNFKLTVRQEVASEAFTGTEACYIPFSGMRPAGPSPSEPREFNLETGAIVVATGFRSYEPRQGEYGFGDFASVITLPTLIRKMAEQDTEGSFLEIDGRRIRSVAMIHCVGSRQIPGIHPEDASGRLNEYCSRTCCTATLNAACRIRETHPGTRVYELYRDIRTYGRGQEELYEQAARDGVVFLRFEPDQAPEVVRADPTDGYPLKIRVTDTLTFSENLEVPADLVVLSTGMEPNDVSDLVEMMKLPVGVDRFLLEVHPKLRPVEMPVGGIFVAGTCQAPFDVGETCNAAGAAAVKAASLLAEGHVELDPFVAEVDAERCKGSGACVEACLNPGALALVEMQIGGQTVRRAQVTPALCLGCGACVAVCPENAIDVCGMTLSQYEAMVDAIVADQVAADALR